MDQVVVSKIFISGEPYKSKCFDSLSKENCSIIVFISSVQIIFSVTDKGNKIVFLQPFQPAYAGLKVGDFVDAVLKNNKGLINSIGTKYIRLLGTDFTIFPAGLSDDSVEMEWKRKLAGQYESTLLADDLNFENARLIYTIETDLLSTMRTSYFGFKLNHVLTSEIDFISSKMPAKTVFCIIHTGYLQIFVKGNRTIDFLNIFNYESPEDLIYYLMAVYKTYSLNPETDKLYLAGEIVKDSAFYQLLYKYIRHVEFSQLIGREKFNDDYPFPFHFYFSLLT